MNTWFYILNVSYLMVFKDENEKIHLVLLVVFLCISAILGIFAEKNQGLYFFSITTTGLLGPIVVWLLFLKLVDFLDWNPKGEEDKF